MNLWVLCCIFGQCFSSSTFFPVRYPEPSSKIVFCLKVYHISDPCPTSVRYQISSNVVLWQNLHCPLSFLQTSELPVFFIFPAQHKKPMHQSLRLFVLSFRKPIHCPCINVNHKSRKCLLFLLHYPHISKRIPIKHFTVLLTAYFFLASSGEIDIFSNHGNYTGVLTCIKKVY